MRFIFARDNENNYGFIYTEGNPADAEQALLAAGLDSFDGLTACGMTVYEQNKALFFSVQKDTSMEGEGYFVYGSYHDGSPEFFARNYKEDFSASVTAENIGAIRSAEGGGLPRTERENKESFSLDRGLLKEIIARLYNGEKIGLTLPDNSFSIEYACGIMAQIYEYLPPVLRRETSFAAGCKPSWGGSVAIMPESMADSMEGVRLSAVAQYYVSDLESEFCPVVDYLLSLSASDRETVFSNYETFFAEYQPKKFLEFLKSFRGNVAATEKIIDVYLANISDPTPEIIPYYAMEAMKTKYNTGVQAAAFLEVSNADELAQPLSVLKNNVSTVKKIYLFNDNPKAVYMAAFERVMNTIDLSDEAFLRLVKGMTEFLKREKEENKKYQICFESAIEEFYLSQSGEESRVTVCLLLRKSAFERIANFFTEKAPKAALSEADSEKLKSEFERVCKPQYEKAELYKYDLATAHLKAVEDAIREHNERMAAPVEVVAPPPVDDPLKKLDILAFALVDKTSYPDQQMAEMAEIMAQYPNVVNLYAANYALKKKTTIKSGRDAFFLNLANTPGRIKEIGAIAFESDPLTALYLVSSYAPADEMVQATLSLVRNNYAVFNNIDSRRAQTAINTVGSVLHKRMNAEGISPTAEVAIENALESFPEKQSNESTAFSMSGNIKLFYEVMCSAFRAFRKGKGFKPKKQKNKSLGWLVALLIILLMLGGGLIALLLMGKLDGFGFGGDHSDTSSAVESSDVSDDVSVDDSSDISDESTESDVSDESNVSDESDVSDDTSTPVPPVEADRITINGTGLPDKSAVSFIANSEFDTTVWDMVVILNESVEDNNIYTVAEIKTNSTIGDLNNYSYALVFHLEEDETKAETQAMMDFVQGLSSGTPLKLSIANGITEFVPANPTDLLPEGAIVLDYFNQFCGDNQAIVRSGDNVARFMAITTGEQLVGFRALLLKDESGKYKVIEACDHGTALTSQLTSTDGALILQFHFVNNNFAEAKARVDAAKALLVPDATIQLFGFDVATETRIPSNDSLIYITP